MHDFMIREIIVQLLGFAIFFWVLKAFAWRPILKVLDDRKAKIEKSFQDIEAGKNDIAKLQKDYGSRIARIEDEARLKIQEGISEGKKIAQELREKARDEATQILLKSKEHIDLEIAKAQLELRSKIVELSLGAAEHILKHEMNEARQKELVEEFIEELSEDPRR